MRLGEIVRQERNRRGWSAQALADRAGVSQPAITRLESGERIGRVDTVMKVTAALGLDPGLVERIMRGEYVQSPPVPSEMGVEELLKTALAQLEAQRGEMMPGKVVLVPVVEWSPETGLTQPEEGGESGREVLPYLPRPEEVGDRYTAVRVKVDDHAPRIRRGDQIVISWNPARAHEGDFVVVETEGHQLLRTADAELLASQNGGGGNGVAKILGVVVFVGRRP